VTAPLGRPVTAGARDRTTTGQAGGNQLETTLVSPSVYYVDMNDDGDPDVGIVRRRITADPEDAEVELLAVIAELEGTTEEELPSLYHELDHVIEALFGTPPSPESQLQITFSYAGYRITMDQRGSVELVKVKESLDP
jgi:hypothetical protein